MTDSEQMLPSAFWELRGFEKMGRSLRDARGVSPLAL